MAKVLIDSSYLLKLTPHEASVLRAALASITVLDDVDTDDEEATKDAEDALVSMHDALVTAGVEEASTRFDMVE